MANENVTIRAFSTQPFRCPVCNGVGTLSAGYYNRTGDVLEWTSGDITPIECRACKGTGIVWR
jgi:hypothetical protein